MSLTEINLSQKNYSVRGLLIILVVFGHVLAKNSSVPGMNFLYLYIYSFHMPLFMIMSGYYGMSTSQKPLKEILITCFTKLFIPFVIVSILYRAEMTIIYGSKFTLHLLSSTTFAMWFLLALIVYRISSKFLIKFKYYLPITFVISLAAVFVPTSILEYGGIMRILSFLCFYYLGLNLRQNDINLSKFKLEIPKIILLLLITLICIGTVEVLNYSGAITLFKADKVEFFKGLPFIKYLFVRVGWYLLAIFMSILIYISVPQNQFLENIGKKSLSIYLGHVFLILLLKSNKISEFVASLPVVFAWVIMIIEVVSIIWIVLSFTKLKDKLKNRYRMKSRVTI